MTSEFILVSTDEDVERLVQRIHADDRLPIVVGTLRETEDAPPWDAAGLASRLWGEADVYLVTAKASYKLTELIGGKANSVHSGWVRIYPASEWLKGDQNRNRITPEGGKANRVAKKVTERILELGFQGYVPASMPPLGLIEDTVVVNQSPTDDVSALLTGRSKSDPSRYPIIRFANIYPGIPAFRLFKKGMELQGSRTTGFLPDFYPNKPIDDPLARFASHVGDIACTWVLVGNVQSESVTVFAHPEIMLVVNGGDEDLTLQYTEGAVIKVLVMRTSEGWEVLPASDEDLAIDAMSALPGGPPWLIPPAPPSVQEGNDEGENDFSLFDDEELIAANREIESLRAEIAKLKDRFRTSRAKKTGAVHQTDELCLRADINANYFERFSAADREASHMAELIFTPEFIADIPAVCQLVNYQTFLRSIVNIALGLPLTRTEKFKGGNPYSEEIDGWQFRRGHIADESRGAARIRFAKKGNVIRFEGAGHHDDDI
jgi:hypothetical protein